MRTKAQIEDDPMIFHARSVSLVALGSLTLAAILVTPARAAVHPGDQLDIAVYNHPELSRKTTVTSAGAVSLPLAGTVVVRGLETKAIAKRIARALDPFVIRPAVEVQVLAQTTSIFLSGPNGGVLKYQPGETLVSALADLPSPGSMAGTSGGGGQIGDLQRSRVDMQHVVLERDGKIAGTFDVLALAARGESGPELQPGDTLDLQNKALGVRVFGDVKRPGYTFLSRDEPLSNAIEQAGGINATGATAHVILKRGGTTSSLALGDAIFQNEAQDGDTITIPTAPRVSVVGLVAKPGPLVLRTDFSLLDALYEAGGPSQYADLSHVDVIRDGKKMPFNVAALQRGDASQNPQLADGDTVYVPEGHKIDFRGIFQSLLPFSFFLPRR